MFMYGAGADPNYEPFLDRPVGDARRLVQRNCMTPLELCHVLAASMVRRGKGGIVLVSSGAGFAGARNMVAYGASKAFDTVMGESLWAELHDQGVDVLVTVLGATDTPAFRRMLTSRGLLPDPDDATPIPGTASPEEAVADVLANLSNGPTLLVGERVREGSKMLRALTRSDAVRAMVAMSNSGVMETGNDEDTVSRIAIDHEVRAAVSEVLVRYATGIDRRDWELFRTCFTEDCDADYGDIGVWHGADVLTGWMRETHALCGRTLHRITNEVMTPHDRGVGSRCYVDALVMGADNMTGTQAIGYYDDVLVRASGEWKIARRHFTLVRAQPIPSPRSP